MEFKVLVERGEIRELDGAMGYLPQASTVFEREGRDLVVLGAEVEGDGGWIYVGDGRLRIEQ
jgi:hypothetical protein